MRRLFFFEDYNRWFADGRTHSCRDAERDKRVTLPDEYDTLEELLDDRVDAIHRVNE